MQLIASYIIWNRGPRAQLVIFFIVSLYYSSILCLFFFWHYLFGSIAYCLFPFMFMFILIFCLWFILSIFRSLIYSTYVGFIISSSFSILTVLWPLFHCLFFTAVLSSFFNTCFSLVDIYCLIVLPSLFLV